MEITDESLRALPDCIPVDTGNLNGVMYAIGDGILKRCIDVPGWVLLHHEDCVFPGIIHNHTQLEMALEIVSTLHKYDELLQQQPSNQQ